MKEVSEILGKFFDSAFLSEGQEYLSFQSKWNEIIGIDLAAHIKIYDLRDGVLICETDHPGWAQMFLLRKKSILKKVQKNFPQLNVRSVRMKYHDKWVEIEKPEKEEIKSIHQKTKEELKVDEDFFELLDKFKERSDS